MDSLNLTCLKQDPTTIGTCGGRLISTLYCISTFAINIYNIWPLPVHDTLLHHIDVVPSISFRENVVHLVCSEQWAL